MRSFEGRSVRKMIRAFELERDAAIKGRAIDRNGDLREKGCLPRPLSEIETDLSLWRARLAEPDPSPEHARAAGKARVAASVVWCLTVGELRLRCLPADDRFEIQVRNAEGWLGLTYGTDPLEMLQRAAKAGSVVRNMKAVTGQ